MAPTAIVVPPPPNMSSTSTSRPSRASAHTISVKNGRQPAGSVNNLVQMVDNLGRGVGGRSKRTQQTAAQLAASKAAKAKDDADKKAIAVSKNREKQEKKALVDAGKAEKALSKLEKTREQLEAQMKRLEDAEKKAAQSLDAATDSMDALGAGEKGMDEKTMAIKQRISKAKERASKSNSKKVFDEAKLRAQNQNGGLLPNEVDVDVDPEVEVMDTHVPRPNKGRMAKSLRNLAGETAAVTDDKQRAGQRTPVRKQGSRNKRSQVDSPAAPTPPRDGAAVEEVDLTSSPVEEGMDDEPLGGRTLFPAEGGENTDSKGANNENVVVEDVSEDEDGDVDETVAYFTPGGEGDQDVAWCTAQAKKFGTKGKDRSAQQLGTTEDGAGRVNPFSNLFEGTRSHSQGKTAAEIAAAYAAEQGRTDSASGTIESSASASATRATNAETTAAAATSSVRFNLGTAADGTAGSRAEAAGTVGGNGSSHASASSTSVFQFQAGAGGTTNSGVDGSMRTSPPDLAAAATPTYASAASSGTSTPNDGTTVTSATTATAPPSVFRAPTYKGVTHGFVPSIHVPTGPSLRFGQHCVEGEGGGYLSLNIDKKEGHVPEDLLIDGTAAVLGYLQQFMPSIKYLPQIEHTPLGPVTAPTPEGGHPQTSMMAQMYFFLERRWQLNASRSPKKPDKNGKVWPDQIQCTLKVECTGNLKELVEMAYYDLKREGLHLRWKEVQEKESNHMLTILGMPDGMNYEGVDRALRHAAKIGEEYLIKHGIVSFELTGVALPPMSFSFRKQREGRMPPDVYEQERLSNVKGFDSEVGCKLVKVEMSPQSWGRMNPIFTWMEEKGALKLIARRATLYENPSGKPEVSDIIEMQRNMSGHLQYSFRQHYEYHPEIATLDKEVEARYEDKRVAEPKFVTLRHFYMGLTNPITGTALIEGIVPIPNRPGRVQLMFFNKYDNAEYIRKIKKSPAAWWWHHLQSLGLTLNCVKSLMDSFRMEARMFAHQSTFDSATWVVKLDHGTGTTDFAADMDELLSDLSDDSDDEVANDPLTMSEDAKEEMLTTIRQKDDFEFNGDDRSRATNFSSSTGNSTNRSASSARMAAQKTLNKELANKLDDAERANDEMQARLSRMETLLATLHGTPPDSGSPAAGQSQPNQDTGSGGCAAGQG